MLPKPVEMPLQASDTTAPVPQSLELSNTNVDLSNGDVSISATTRLIDDISGIGDANSLSAEVRWRSPSGNQFIDASFFAYRDGNDNDATFENSYPITFNANAETGTWTIENFYTRDEAGNSKWYNSDELVDLGINTTINITNASPSDTTAPVPQSLELSNTNVDLSNGDVSISATTRLIDDISGIGDANSLSAEVRWRSPSGNQFIDASFFAYRDGNDNDATFENSYPITFNANAETGTWTIENFYTRDEAGNSKRYNSDELVDLGINTTINITNASPSDTTAPVPQSLELSNTNVDLSNGDVSISATTRLIDDISGIGDANSLSAEVRWRSPSGNQFIDASFFAYRDGNDNDATFENSYPITFNANAETGTWTIENFYTRDEAGNSKWYNSDELIDLGINTTINITNASPSDTTAPVPQSLELSNTNVDLSNGDVSISATTRLIDDISGIGDANSLSAEVRWRSPSGNQFIDASFFAYRDGNDNDATFENSYPITFNANAETGTWTIENFYTRDEAGNETWLGSEDLASLGIQTTFEVVRNPNGGDSTPPDLISYNLDSYVIDLSNGDVNISHSAHLVDAISGIATEGRSDGFDDLQITHAEWISPSGNASFYSGRFNQITSGDHFNGTFTTESTLNEHSENGIWTLDGFFISDKAGNETWLGSEDLASLGIQTTFEVIGNQNGGDSTPPDLLSYNLDSYVFDLSNGDVNISHSAHLADTISGIATEGRSDGFDDLQITHAEWISPSGNASFYSGRFNQITSGDHFNGTFTTESTLNEHSENGIWTLDGFFISDKAGNETWLGSEDFASLEIQTTFEVIGNPNGGDSTPPDLLSYNLDSYVFDLSNGDVNISHSAHLADTSSGIATEGRSDGFDDLQITHAEWISPSGNASFYSGRFNQITSGDHFNGTFTTESTLNEHSENGIWTLDGFFISDKAGNETWLGSEDLELLGIQTSFEVTGGSNSKIPENKITLSTDIYSVSAAQANDLSQALTFNNGSQTLNNYLDSISSIPTNTTSSSTNADIFAVNQDNAASGDNYYVLDVDAKANFNYNINSYDISLGYDKDLFEILDLGINGEFNLFNNAVIDSDIGTVRVVGGSAENLGDSFGGGTSDGNTFQLLLKAKHNDAHNSRETVNAVFTAKVNSYDTVLADGEDIIHGTSELLTSNYTFANSFIDFETSNNIAFATKRLIGIADEDQKYTSLLREGSDIDSLGTFNVSTLGNITAAYQASIEQTATDIYTVDFIEGQSANLDHVKGNASHIDGSINSYQLRMSVEGSAGDIIDLSQTSIKVSDAVDPEKYVETSALSGKNLITYQSDINYDGRVSMIDLAYLNAGAGQTSDASINDVDVNYDNIIDLSDLEKMDEQWGNSLHTDNLIENDIFTGTNGTINLTGISIADQGVADNSSFVAQNNLENTSSDFVGTLVDAGTSGYTGPEFSGNYGEIYNAEDSDADPI